MASITLSDVCVDLPVYDATHRSFRRAILSGVGGMMSRPDRKHVVVRALDRVSMTLEKGVRVGVVGHNGAGKSTLLKVLAGIYEPTSGSAMVSGRVSSLLDMSAILDPEMTGYENIDHARVLLGIAGRSAVDLCRDVEAFTELGNFLDMPVRTYSAGMKVRLSFALLTAQEPDVVLLDEVLGAGDAAFVHKAARRAKVLCERAGIVVMTSHSLEQVRHLCTSAAWLERGRLRAFGPVEEVLAAYTLAMRD